MKPSALHYASIGLPVFPCARNGKRPLCGHGCRDATSDLKQIEQWWTDWPDANIGLATGTKSGVVVYDADVKDGRPGLETLRRLEQAADVDWSKTATVKTPSGGIHKYLCHPGSRVPNRANIGRSPALPATGLDSRGDGGYVLLPPSVIDGCCYEWVVPFQDEGGDDNLAEYVDLAPPRERVRPSSQSQPFSGQIHPRAGCALREECEAIRSAPEGSRNEQIFKSVAALYELEAAGDIDSHTIQSHVIEAANSYIADDGEVAFCKTFESAQKAGRSNPREPAKYTPFDFDAAEPFQPPQDRSHHPPKGGGNGGKNSDWSRSEAPKDRSGDPERSERSESLDSCWANFLAEVHKRASGYYKPIPSGIENLDSILGGGAQPAAITLVCGNPGEGKTSLALEWALRYATGNNAIQRSGPAIILSLEMSDFDLRCRMVCQLEGTDWVNTRIGMCVSECEVVASQLNSAPLYVLDFDACSTFEKLSLAYNMIVQKFEAAPLVVVDYAQLVDTAIAETEARQAANRASYKLLKFIRSTGATMIALSSVSRRAYQALSKDSTLDMEKVLSAAKESGQFEFDAAAVLRIGLLPASEPDQPRFGWIGVGKNRLGGHVGSVAVRFDGREGRFSAATEADVFEAAGGIELKEALERLVEFVSDHPTVKDKAEIAKKMKVRKTDVVGWFRVAEAKGLLYKDANDYWRVNE
jgi:predicted Fe-Mo cluster-binding NifX family protein